MGDSRVIIGKEGTDIRRSGQRVLPQWEHLLIYLIFEKNPKIPEHCRSYGWDSLFRTKTRRFWPVNKKGNVRMSLIPILTTVLFGAFPQCCIWYPGQFGLGSVLFLRGLPGRQRLVPDPRPVPLPLPIAWLGAWTISGIRCLPPCSRSGGGVKGWTILVILQNDMSKYPKLFSGNRLEGEGGAGSWFRWWTHWRGGIDPRSLFQNPPAVPSSLDVGERCYQLGDSSISRFWCAALAIIGFNRTQKTDTN